MAVRLTEESLIPKSGRLVIKHPLTGDDTDLVITVRYPASGFIRNLIKEAGEREFYDDNRLYYIMAMLIENWEGPIEGECDYDNKMEFLTNPDHDFIVEQLDAYMQDKHNFFSAEKKSQLNIINGSMT